ncbi:MAG TPA: LuxR C-terminal-related transcriptional regulator [Pseudonocardiaceae bacterium]|jgi:DNA-binding CsgD family transcriptional regulator
MPGEDAERPRALAGLVSERAEELYTRLLVSGGIPIGTGQGEVDIADPAAGELLDTGVAFRTGEDDRLLRPVTPASALRVLLERRQRELGEAQRRILDGWERLTAQLPATIGGRPSSVGEGSGVRLLTDLAEIATTAAELWRAPTQRLRGTETGDFPTRPTENRLFTPPTSALRRGALYQMIYQANYRNTPWGGRIIDSSVAAGEQAKLRLHVPVKMFHVDNTIALVGIDRAARTALLIHAPEVLTLVAEWFDAMWNDPASVAVGREQADGLTDVQRKVLELMVVGLSDETIARQQNLSVRTVRRHVNAIYRELNVTSRFAAGVAAAKRGWL